MFVRRAFKREYWRAATALRSQTQHSGARQVNATLTKCYYAPFYHQLSPEHVTDLHCGLCQHSTVIYRLCNGPLPVDCSMPLPYLYYSEGLHMSVTGAFV